MSATESADDWLRAAVHLHAEGDLGQATVAYRRAVELGDPAWLPMAATRLAALLEAAGDTAGAADAYRRAVTAEADGGAERRWVRVRVDVVGCGRPEARGLLRAVIAVAGADGRGPALGAGADGRRTAGDGADGRGAVGPAGAVVLVTSDEVLRDEARRAGFAGRLRQPLVLPAAPAPPADAGRAVAPIGSRLEAMVPGIAVIGQPPSPWRAAVRSAVSGLVSVVDLDVDLGDGGPTVRLTVPGDPDLLPEAVAQALDTVAGVRRRFGPAVHHVRSVSFDLSDRGFRSGRLAGTAHRNTGAVNLNAAAALPGSFTRLARSAGPGAAVRPASGVPPFHRIEATTAHELWHNIEGGFQSRNYRESIRFRQGMGEYFGVATLEHAVEGRGARAPEAWRRARARLVAEVSEYAGTNATEATAEIFELWWCARPLSPVAGHFGDLIDRFFPAPDAMAPR